MHASTSTPRALIGAAYAACCLLWGSTWMVVKIGLEDLPPLRFAAMRMLLAFLMLSPFVLRRGLRGVTSRQGAALVGLGTVQIGAVYALQFLAQQWIPSGLAAIMFATFAVWVQLGSRLALPGYRLSGAALGAVALGIGGVIVIQVPAVRGVHLGLHAGLGAGLVLLGAILCAAVNVVVRLRFSTVPPLLMTWGNLIGGVLVLGALALAEAAGGGPAVEAARFTPRAWAALLHLSLFGTVVTYVTFYWLLPRISMAAVGTLPLLDTAVAVVLGTLVMREALHWEVVAGGALVLASVALANLGPSAEVPRVEVVAEHAG